MTPILMTTLSAPGVAACVAAFLVVMTWPRRSRKDGPR